MSKLGNLEDKVIPDNNDVSIIIEANPSKITSQQLTNRRAKFDFARQSLASLPHTPPEDEPILFLDPWIEENI